MPASSVFVSWDGRVGGGAHYQSVVYFRVITSNLMSEMMTAGDQRLRLFWSSLTSPRCLGCDGRTIGLFISSSTGTTTRATAGVGWTVKPLPLTLRVKLWTSNYKGQDSNPFFGFPLLQWICLWASYCPRFSGTLIAKGCFPIVCRSEAGTILAQKKNIFRVWASKGFLKLWWPL